MRKKQIAAIRHNTTMYSDQLEKAKRLSKVLFNSSRPNVSGLIQHLIDNVDDKSLINVTPTRNK